MNKSLILIAMILCGCSRRIVYRIPVIVPPVMSSEQAGCADALQKAYTRNTTYLKELKIKKATALKPVILPAPGFTEDQYRNSCVSTLTAIAASNIQLNRNSVK